MTRDLAEAARADAILLVVPAQAMRAVLDGAGAGDRAGTPVIACAKGIEHGTHKFMTEIVAECAPNALPAILSGPSFAADVARGLPTAVTSPRPMPASPRRWRTRIELAARSGPIIRPTCAASRSAARRRTCWRSPPASSPAAASAPARSAALTTRGFAELVRFGRACGAKTETMMGLSGLGDLILTCSTPQSRNFSFGVALGKGEAPDTARTASSPKACSPRRCCWRWRATKNVDMPISEAVAAVLAGA